MPYERKKAHEYEKAEEKVEEEKEEAGWRATENVAANTVRTVSQTNARHCRGNTSSQGAAGKPQCEALWKTVYRTAIKLIGHIPFHPPIQLRVRLPGSGKHRSRTCGRVLRIVPDGSEEEIKLMPIHRDGWRA